MATEVAVAVMVTPSESVGAALIVTLLVPGVMGNDVGRPTTCLACKLAVTPEPHVPEGAVALAERIEPAGALEVKLKLLQVVKPNLAKPPV